MLTTIWKTQAIKTRLRALISSFLANARGNVAVITALSALPIISAIGCVVDYSMATTIKTKLQAAADAATLAAVSANSPLVATAKSMTGNGAVSNGATYTQNFFDSEFEQLAGEHGLQQPYPNGYRYQERDDRQRNAVFHGSSCHVPSGDYRPSDDRAHRTVDIELHVAVLHRLLSDARRLRFHGDAVHHC